MQPVVVNMATIANANASLNRFIDLLLIVVCKSLLRTKPAV
jgi:hypothetical protein